MPFTNAPIVATYSTKRIPLATDILYRAGLPSVVDGSITDAGMVNVLPFKDGAVTVGETRASLFDTANFTGIMRGMYVWEKTPGTSYFFCVVGTSVYTSTDGVTFAAVTTLLTNVTTPVRFTEYIDGTNVKKLILVDGVEGYVFTTNAAGTKIVDADFPTPHVPFPVFLDGYLFLAKASTGDIYNSDLNAPESWTAGSFISAEMYPDDLQALVKIGNYIVAIGAKSCEYFYDAANAVASPLARSEGLSLPVGTIVPNSIAVNYNTIIMVATRNDGSGILVEIENEKFREFGNNFVVPLLQNRLNSSSLTPAKVRSYLFRQRGELFYALAFSDQHDANDSNYTFVYSFTEKMWSQFVWGTAGTGGYPVSFTAPATTTMLGSFVAGNFTTGLSYFGQMAEENSVYLGTDRVGAASFVNIYQELRTPNIDFETSNMKQMSRLTLDIEFKSVRATEALGTITVLYSDDDYQTYTSRTLFGLNTADGFAVPYGYYPSITQLGMFRRRSFKFTNSTGAAIRWKLFEVDINKGQQ